MSMLLHLPLQDGGSRNRQTGSWPYETKGLSSAHGLEHALRLQSLAKVSLRQNPGPTMVAGPSSPAKQPFLARQRLQTRPETRREEPCGSHVGPIFRTPLRIGTIQLRGFFRAPAPRELHNARPKEIRKRKKTKALTNSQVRNLTRIPETL